MIDATRPRLRGVETWQDKLREKGYRLTPQRELVLRAVERLGHGTPEEILIEVHKDSQAVNPSTVYRTLEVLEDLELVHHTHITDRAPTYHSTSLPQHVHLVCRGCQKVIDASPSEFDGLTSTLLENHDFESDVAHLTVFGLCADCRRS